MGFPHAPLTSGSHDLRPTVQFSEAMPFVVSDSSRWHGRPAARRPCLLSSNSQYADSSNTRAIRTGETPVSR